MMIQSSKTSKHFDTAIVGTGALGLWAARHAIKRGEEVVLLEKRIVGAGASGGFLGALMPHMPDVWNYKKQLQYDGLSSIADAVSELEEDTGIKCGFRRCGRVLPLQNEGVLSQVERRIVGAANNWADEYKLTYKAELSDSHLSKSGWINREIAVHGIQFDTLAARINPRHYIRALEAFVRPRATIFERSEVTSIATGTQNDNVSLSLACGSSISATKVVVANGWEAYPLLQPFMNDLNDGNSVGRGVKGQAVLVEWEHDDELPIVYHDGSYVVPHVGNLVAIGSTSENTWSGEPDFFDPSKLEFYERALSLVPALKGAPIVGRWAGVRPRNTLEKRGTSPWLGAVPEHRNLIALIGGFKITLGIAHLDHLDRAQCV